MRPILHRPALIVLVLGMLATACVADTSDPSSAPSAPDTSAAGPDAAEADADAAPGPQQAPLPGAVIDEPVRETSVNCDPDEFHWRQRDCQPAAMVDVDEIFGGGPPPDGIPPIDDPVFESIDDAATWLEDTSPVMVVEVDDTVRLYPLAILTWHEIVNDRLAGEPIAVTYCPLCNSGLAFSRTVVGPDGPEVLDFGTSGRLWRSNLVMYDRQHLGLWTQFTGQAIVGERWLGATLERIPSSLLGFGDAGALAPDAEVLSRETGRVFDYGRNPYVAYDALDNSPRFFREDADPTLPEMTRVVGLGGDTDAVAITLERLTDEQVVEVELDAGPVTVWWAPGQASALDTERIDDAADIGQTVAFDATHDGRTLRFDPADGNRFVDDATGSTWDLRGRAVDGPLAGARLTPVARDDTFWFVWAVYRPTTDLIGAAAADR